MSKAKPAAAPVAHTEEVKTEEKAHIKSHGTFVFPDGSKYIGDYLETDGVRVRDGHGTLQNGPETFVGSWVNDQIHGKGKYTFANGELYEGEFVNGLFEGLGTYHFIDGGVYKGHWYRGTMHGKGEYTDAKKKVWKGSFFNGTYDSGATYLSLRPT